MNGCRSGIRINFFVSKILTQIHLIMNGLPEWIWRPDSLLPQIFMLNDISAKVLNPKQLLEEKEVYEQIGRIPRQKDAESKKILRQIIDGTLFKF